MKCFLNEKNNNIVLITFLLTIIVSFPVYSELTNLTDADLSQVSGQLMLDPLGDLADEVFTQISEVEQQAISAGEFSMPNAYDPLTSLQLAEQNGQGVRLVHNTLPTGARSPDPRIGNINFYGRDYRSGDNFDRVTDCLESGACGANWDPDNDGIPGTSGGNPDFIPAGDGTPWAAGGDGQIDDFYYAYDYFTEYGAHATVPDSPVDWQFYRIETDALIKIVATVDRLSQGGYTANYGSCGNAFEVLHDLDPADVLTDNGVCGSGYSGYSTGVPGTEGQENDAAYRANYQGADDRLLEKTDRSSYFSYDTELRGLQLGNISCGNSISGSRAEFLSGNGAYFGHCEADERKFDPLVLKNPFTEIALAPECELFAEPACDDPDANTDLVFAGYRSGFDSVSGNAKLVMYSASGVSMATINTSNNISCDAGGNTNGPSGPDLGTNQSACDAYTEVLDTFAANGVLLYGHRGRGMPALPGKLCIQGGTLGIVSNVCVASGTGGEGLLSSLGAQDIKGLWSYVARNDFQWPGQGWSANDGVTTAPNAWRDTLADRNYAGVGTRIGPGGIGHGGTVINNYSPPVIFGIGAAYTHVKIGL